MSATAPIFAYPIGNTTGDLADQGSPSGSTQVSGYPLANMYNGNPALPVKFTGTGMLISWDFGSAKSIELLALIHHNFDDGLDVYLQASTDNFATVPLSQQIIVPAKDQDGYTVSVFTDVSAIPHSYRYWRLNANNNSNSVPIIIGEVCLIQTKRQLTHGLQFSTQLIEEAAVTTHRTNLGVELTYQNGQRIKRLRGQIRTSDWATVQAWRRATRGASRPHLLIPNPSVNEAWFGKWDQDDLSMNLGANGPAARDLSFSWREVSRGLPWSEI